MTTKITTGYKGHRKGCMKEKAHRLFDDNPKLARKEVCARIVKLGTTEGTASSWYQGFKAGKRPGVKPAAKKVAAKLVKPATKKVAATPAKPKETK